MALKEILFLVIHWIHTIAAVAWIGGGLFYIFILRNQKGRFSIELDASLRKDFRALVTTAMGILLVTGSVMTFDRLSSGVVG